MPMPGTFPSADYRAILLTGASSGIGRELALAYAAHGTELHLCGRDRERLALTAEACRRRGAAVSERVADVTDAPAMEAWVTECDRRSPLDLVIANAGIYAGTEDGGDETAEQTRAVFDTNLSGTLNTVLPVLPAMRGRRRGHIALVSSFAGFRGHGTMPAYCGSKAAVRVWGEALRDWLAADGVQVTVICPGKVRTASCQTPGDHVLGASAAARLIRNGIRANQARVAFPSGAYARAWTSAAIPPPVREWLHALKGNGR